MRLPNAVMALSVLASLSSCSSKQILEKIAPKAEVEFAKQYLGELRAGRLDEVERQLDVQVRTPDIRIKLAEVASYFPPGEPKSVELIGSHVFQGPDRWSANLSFQYGFENAWLVANVVLERKNGGLVVMGVHVNRIPDSLERINAFTMKGKGPIHYLFLGGVALVVSFIFVILVVCLRCRDLPRKWLWALFILIGVVTLNINWTTGKIGFQPVSFHLLGAGATTAGPYAPWLLHLSFPLGAVMFLARRRRARPTPSEGTQSPALDPR